MMKNSIVPHTHRWGSLCFSTALLAMGLAGQAMAQETGETASAGVLEEVIVTATKRAENIQDIAVSITARFFQ